MSLDQRTLRGQASAFATTVTRRGRGTSRRSAYYNYRRRRNVPEGEAKSQDSVATAGNENAERRDVVEDSLSKLSSGREDSSTKRKENSDATSTQVSKLLKRKVCKYFVTEKSCFFGERCRYLHIPNETKGDISGSAPSGSAASKLERFVTRPNVVTISKEDVGKQEQWDVRNSEINYLARRFRDTKFAYDGSSYIIEFEYKITDPEWAFETKVIRLRFKIPEQYPCAMMTITLNELSLPNPLITYLDRKIKEFLEEKFMEAEKCDAYTGISKIFIRWLDHHIFELFVEGLRKTKMIFEAENEGITLHSAGPLNFTTSKEQNHSETYEAETLSEKETTICSNFEIWREHNYDEADVRFLPETEAAEQNAFRSRQQPASTKVIEVRVLWNDLSGNIATLTIVAITLSIRCAKCNALSFLTCSAKQLSVAHCQKCLNGHSVRVSPLVVHENSNVVALLEPKGCIPVDCVLLSSKLIFTCLQCNRGAVAENLTYGTVNKTWCYSCHSKCEFEITAIRFAGDFNSIAKEDSTLPKVRRKERKMEQSMVIIEGQSLPGNGTCKHYRKSYRWFRFPCCGKLYPCDLCHSEAENGHEMKLANRMVCGFCSKEQPFQKAKPCINCNEHVTRLKSQFWEGGKGCRDQVLMSRNDRRKHTNSSMKTVSKKHTAHMTIKNRNNSTN